MLSYRCESWQCAFDNASAAHMCCEYRLGMFAGFSMAFFDFSDHCKESTCRLTFLPSQSQWADGYWMVQCRSAAFISHCPAADSPEEWCCSGRVELAIAAVEMVAQQALLIARAKVCDRRTLANVCLRQQSDHGLRRFFGQGSVLKAALVVRFDEHLLDFPGLGVQGTGVACCRRAKPRCGQTAQAQLLGFKIDDDHFRRFPPELQVVISVNELFAPWKSFRQRGVPKGTGRK